MTVRDLIAKLQRMVATDPAIGEYAVGAEGCDCYGLAVDVKIERGQTVGNIDGGEAFGNDKSPYVLVAREPRS